MKWWPHATRKQQHRAESKVKRTAEKALVKINPKHTTELEARGYRDHNKTREERMVWRVTRPLHDFGGRAKHDDVISHQGVWLDPDHGTSRSRKYKGVCLTVV